MDLNTKLEGIKRTFKFNVSAEAGAESHSFEAEVDFSNTTVKELLDTYARRSIVVAIQNNNYRKRGEKWLSDPANQHQKGTLQSLTKSARQGSLESLRGDEIFSMGTEEQKRQMQHAAIKAMVDAGQAEWVDEDKLTFELVQ